MPQKKSDAYYRFCQDRANGNFSYYDSEEIEQIAFDLIDDGNMSDAQYVADMGLKQHPDDESIQKLAIWIYIHSHRVGEAERLFEKIKDDGSEATFRLKFCLMVLHGHPQQALNELTEATKTKFLSPIDWITTIDEMNEAIPLELLPKYLLEVSKLDTNTAESLARIGAKLMDCDKLDKAIVVLEKALDIDTYDIYTWQDLARCYFELGDMKRATEACDYGIAIEPENALLNFMRGYVHYQRKEWNEAILKLEVARRFAEGKADADIWGMTEKQIQEQISVTYHMLGFSYCQTGKMEKAIECYNILKEREPSNPESFMRISSIYLASGNLNEAAYYAKQASEVEPLNTEIRAMLVSVYTTMHKFDEAVAELQAILRIKPNNKNYLLAYAELQSHLGHNTEADEAYRQILALKPKDKATRTLLKNYFASIGDEDALSQLG